ncbi:MAG: hypothetical protein P9M03_03195 [Candidatus Theseobacter exili]|nr:hypothetical protein [Candidatus Theseobacter exili]
MEWKKFKRKSKITKSDFTPSFVNSYLEPNVIEHEVWLGMPKELNGLIVCNHGFKGMPIVADTLYRFALEHGLALATMDLPFHGKRTYCGKALIDIIFEEDFGFAEYCNLFHLAVQDWIDFLQVVWSKICKKGNKTHVMGFGMGGFIALNLAPNISNPGAALAISNSGDLGKSALNYFAPYSHYIENVRHSSFLKEIGEAIAGNFKYQEHYDRIDPFKTCLNLEQDPLLVNGSQDPIATQADTENFLISINKSPSYCAAFHNRGHEVLDWNHIVDTIKWRLIQ